MCSPIQKDGKNTMMPLESPVIINNMMTQIIVLHQIYVLHDHHLTLKSLILMSGMPGITVIMLSNKILSSGEEGKRQRELLHIVVVVLVVVVSSDDGINTVLTTSIPLSPWNAIIIHT